MAFAGGTWLWKADDFFTGTAAGGTAMAFAGGTWLWKADDFFTGTAAGGTAMAFAGGTWLWKILHCKKPTYQVLLFCLLYTPAFIFSLLQLYIYFCF